ncbi:MAG TPA: Crp/Fnr family transcriptional regulator [Bryobacteraceae bacterium]|jgi:CRP/FNR family cyclic AMP-dependent transcriptional regulator|nr:Crp/Fnr family transcriptional regulator [Bryobacteraceae bacterium]HXR75221.1 Crp/Fnr family transcriptional regulator [Bryobacteraceae bacterium]
MNPNQLPAIIATLKATQLFSALDNTEISAIAGRTLIRRFSAGELLFSEGEPCEGLYAVAAGRVRIFKTSPAGREQVLTIEGPGSSIAELPVFDGGPYPASAAAVDEAQLLFVSRSDFRACCLEHPEVALKLLQVVGGRLRRLVGIIEELSFTTLRHRLIAWLLREAQAHGHSTPEGTTFELGISHQELAAHIGTVRELVSRNMARLQAQGLIRAQGREITILDSEGLESELGSSV